MQYDEDQVSRAVRTGAEAVRAVLTERDPEALIDRVLDTALHATGGSRGFLLLSGGEGFEVAATRGFGSKTTSDEDLQLSHTIAHRVYRGGHPVHTSDARTDHRFLGADSVQDHGIGSVICVPLALEGEAIGVLYLDRPAGSGPFAPEAVALAVPLADAASQALARAPSARPTLERLWEGESGVKRLRAELALRFAGSRLVGNSPAVRGVLQLVARVAHTNAPVLIWGESGTGKELVARMIHAASGRTGGPFEAILCSALPDEIMEAELFGHVKGAFTGAEGERPGLFTRGDGGTVLLDDLGAMPLPCQAKILRVLQEGALRPLGGREQLKVDFRVLSILVEDPQRAVAEGSLREDLFHRLATIPIRVPPLREREGDVPLLVEHFIAQESQRPRVLPEAMALLEAYPWPGNVRELKNELIRAAVIADGEIGPRHLSPRLRGERPIKHLPTSPDEVRPLDVVEREAIENAMRVFEGNRVKVAQALGMARSTLYKRLEKYGLA